MKLETLSKSNVVIAYFSLFLFAAIGQLTAQSNNLKDITNNEYALVNLLDGIMSENEGVKRSSIYLVGKYRIAEAEQVLIEQLEMEENPSNRILIALVLYEIGSENGLLEVKKLISNDDNHKVRRMSTHIYNEYLTNNSKGRLVLGNQFLN